MSATSNTIHKVQGGQTLASLVAAYRLSSKAAILDSPGNVNIRPQLAVEGELPIDLFVHIPPNAAEILQERMRLANELKPVLLAHFDTLQELAETELLPALMEDTYPFHSDEVTSILQHLGEFSLLAIDRIGENSTAFIELGKAMALTHVATADDRALAAASGYAEAGLSWAISPGGLSAWQSLWTREVWDGRWNRDSVEAAAQSTLQYITTVRSIVVQQVDRRFRESLRLLRQLREE
jgi:hypothetical protein